jgi:hypothetical protein
MHGHFYIILKESLKYIPVLGVGMMFYGFIFMSRKMAVDQPRMAHRLGKLKKRHLDPSGKEFLNPMWLLLFPEGTNASNNSRRRSVKWAEKNGLEDPKHVLLPRSTGTYFCLEELKGTLDYVYDCTVAYEGIPYAFSHILPDSLSSANIGTVEATTATSTLRFPAAIFKDGRPSQSIFTGAASVSVTFRPRLPRNSISGFASGGTKRTP